MNLLTPLFLERFSSKKYYDSTGRSYVEYICGKQEGYTGKICFFHFSFSGERKNAYMNLEIIAFIKAYYSRAYIDIYPLMKYAILHDIVVTFNSYDEYSFLIKFQSHNSDMNLIVEKFLKKYTGVKIGIGNDEKNRFYEIIITLKPDFKIERFRLYREEENFLCDDVLEYTAKENVFMVLYITDFLFTQKEEQKYLFSQGYLYKFKNPRLLSESIFLKSTFGTMLEKYFPLDSLYLAFVEKMQESENDILYFTDGFSVPA